VVLWAVAPTGPPRWFVITVVAAMFLILPNGDGAWKPLQVPLAFAVTGLAGWLAWRGSLGGERDSKKSPKSGGVSGSVSAWGVFVRARRVRGRRGVRDVEACGAGFPRGRAPGLDVVLGSVFHPDHEPTFAVGLV
jgi:hypothetical protein